MSFALHHDMVAPGSQTHRETRARCGGEAARRGGRIWRATDVAREARTLLGERFSSVTFMYVLMRAFEVEYTAAGEAARRWAITFLAAAMSAPPTGDLPIRDARGSGGNRPQ